MKKAILPLILTLLAIGITCVTALSIYRESLATRESIAKSGPTTTVTVPKALVTYYTTYENYYYSFEYPLDWADLSTNKEVLKELDEGIRLGGGPDLVFDSILGIYEDTYRCIAIISIGITNPYPEASIEELVDPATLLIDSTPVSTNLPNTLIFKYDEPNLYTKMYYIYKLSGQRFYYFGLLGSGKDYYSKIDTCFNKFLESLRMKGY